MPKSSELPVQEEPFLAVKSDLIQARRCVAQGMHREAILYLKWAIEKLLPEGQQYCSQTLPDSDPEKTIRGYLDNIIVLLINSRGKP